MSFQNAGNVSTWAGGSGIGGQLGLYMTLFQTTKMVLSECQRSTALEKDLGSVSTTQTCLYHLLLLWTFHTNPGKHIGKNNSLLGGGGACH